MKGSSFMIKTLKIILIFLLCFPLVGCQSKIDDSLLKEEGTPLIIILGKHANANMFTDFSDNLNNLINESLVITDNGNGYDCKADISIIVNDGYPTTEKLNFKLENSTQEYNEEFLEQNINKIKRKIKGYVLSDQLIADDEETDLLSALSEAESTVHEQANIYIYDSGITTTGYLNMNNSENDIMNHEVDDIVKRLSEEDAIPTLKGKSIIFEGIGNVAGAQISYKSNTKYKKQLTDLWDEILKKAGADIKEKINFSNIEGTPMIYNEDEEGEAVYPYVSPVTVDIENLDSGKGVYQSTQLGFEPQSAEFIDGTTLAKKLIRDSQLDSLINFIDHEEGNIYVVGSVAKTSQDQNLKNDSIANARAQKVKDILVELGVPSTRIQTIDAGTTVFSWRDADEFPNGEKNPNNQEVNRVVAVIPNSQDCADAVKELKDAGYIK